MSKPWIALITGREIKKNRGGSKTVRLLQSEVTAQDDTQTIEHLRQAGIDSGPPDDSRAFVTSLGSAWKLAFAIDDGITPEAVPGELILYSQAAGAKTSIIKLNVDGSINITTTSAVNVIGDVIADGISLKNHFHLGNLAFNTGSPVVGAGTPAPATPATTDSNGDIISGGGISLDNHIHGGVTTGGGTTSGPQ